LVAIGPDGQEFSADGTLEGSLALAPRGANGFGYDPILIPQGETRTCAELSADEKNAISHRGAAAHVLRDQLGL
jgi:XTP/dITP diphosphohydrolase